jgi:hypothetical protein
MGGRLLGVAGLTLGLIGAMTSLAGAATIRVEHGEETFPVDEIDTELCDFPIRIQAQATNRFTIFSDTQGTLQRLVLHFSITEGTVSANGVSLRQGSNHNTTTVLFDSSGNPTRFTVVGLTTQWFLPDSTVIGAGRLIEDGSTKTAVFEAGNRITPEDQQALCTALSG